MADIFEIKSVDIELRIPRLNKVFKFADPKIIDKVKIKKQWDLLEKKKAKMGEEDYFIEAFNLNKKMIQMYLPAMSSDDIESLGGAELETLLGHITKLTEDKFGATVEKVEKK